MNRRGLIRNLFVTAALGSLAPLSWATSPTYTPPKRVLIGTEGLYSPFTYKDATGQLTGFDVEVARAIGKKLGIQIDFVTAPWDALIAGLDAKRFDAVFNQVTPNPERQAKYNLTTPYMVEHGALIVRSDNTQIKSFADVKGRKSANTFTTNWGQYAKSLGAQMVTIQDSTQAFQLVATRRVDLTINSEIAFETFKKAQPNIPLKKVAQTDFGVEASGLFRKEDVALSQLFSQAIIELINDGTIAQLSQKFLGVDASPAKK